MKKTIFLGLFVSLCFVFIANLAFTGPYMSAGDVDLSSPGAIGGTTPAAATFNPGVTYTDLTDSHTISAIQEAGLGGRLTVGLDETARTMVICDDGDKASDFGLSASSFPMLKFIDTDADSNFGIGYCADDQPCINTDGDNFYIQNGGGSAAYFGSGGISFYKTVGGSAGFFAGNGAFKYNGTGTVDLNSGQTFSGAAGDDGVSTASTWTNTTGTSRPFIISPTYNQASGDAVNTDFQIYRTETAVGSGAQNLIMAGTVADPDMFKVDNSGNTTVAGTLHAVGAITSDAGCCADYVFEDGYKLKSLAELKQFISDNNHLPDMTMMVGNNKSVNINQAIHELLVKTEEQALYILQLDERLKQVEKVSAVN